MEQNGSLIKNESKDLAEIKTEIALCIEHCIATYKNENQKIDDLTFQCVSALAEVDNAQKELSEKGFLARFVGSITGSNHKLQDKINRNQTLAQYALRETLMQLQKQNLMTQDLVCAVNTKLNGMQMQLGRMELCLENLLDRFKKEENRQDLILVNHERRITENEKDTRLGNWCQSICHQKVGDKEYQELAPYQKIASLARDFFDRVCAGDSLPTEDDAALLKTAIDDLGLKPDAPMPYYETLKDIAVDDLAREKLLGDVDWRIYNSVDFIISFHTIGKICELQQKDSDKIELLCNLANHETRESACKLLVSSYIQRKDQCDVNMKISLYDLVMDLVFNLRYLHENASTNDVKLLNGPTEDEQEGQESGQDTSQADEVEEAETHAAGQSDGERIGEDGDKQGEQQEAIKVYAAEDTTLEGKVIEFIFRHL